MPPKKDKAAKTDNIDWDTHERAVRSMVRTPERWVQIHFKLVSSALLDDVIRLPSTANLYMVETKLVQHHGGSISKLMFWKDDIQPKNLVRDLHLSLKDIWGLEDDKPSVINNANIPSSSGGWGIGSKRYSDIEDHQVVLCYDYKAHDSDCPLLLRSPRYSVDAAAIAQAARENTAGTSLAPAPAPMYATSATTKK